MKLKNVIFMYENKTRNIAQRSAPAKPAHAPSAAPAKVRAPKPVPAPLAGMIPGLLMVVRVRGLGGMHPKREQTMRMLNLPRTYNATLVKSDASYLGMLQEAKDYLAWGPVSQKMLLALVSKRATANGHKLSEVKEMSGKLDELVSSLAAGKKPADLGLDRTFHLTPPSGGWKGRKVIYPRGDLGPRPSMDELLKRMI